MRSRDIRQSFIDFFVERGHRLYPSAPLVPHGDATLLFTNAGMVQFKNFFLGLEKPEHPRAVTAQKCLRVSGKHNDLENVGPSPRHHTFFEMLGNFSFGDYFKEEAILYGWELVTAGWGIRPENLFATVYREDDEAHDLWLKVSSLPPERVIRCGKSDNFWAMGDTGPCGPCSEIFIDCAPGEPEVPFDVGSESGRYLEIWNLVFMQFDQSADGQVTPLPKPSIDTGSGLERVAAALQRHSSNYDTDLFQPLLMAAAEAAGRRYGQTPEDDVSLRVIADHIRAVAFLLADGVIPSNDGRGYVLRRILRRAVRHGLQLGLEEPFLGRLLPVLDEIMGDAYPELGATRAASEATIVAEERKFLDTVATGALRVQQAIDGLRSSGGAAVLAGDQVFRLYDTYGLPLEMVQEIAEEEQVEIDEEGFREELERQRTRSRSATSELQGQMGELRRALIAERELEATEFLGYDELTLEGAKVLALAVYEEGGVGRRESLEPGGRGVAVFDKTVFYAESGGQVADTGVLEWSGGRALVDDTQRDNSGVFLHFLEVKEGVLTSGAELRQQVDDERRQSTERHHTATHLLHAALRESLGEGVRQAGSLVHPERLRFDYTYGSPLDQELRKELESRVSEWVRRAVPVDIRLRSYDEAIKAGAMALFGEKYGDVVRTVQVPGFSLELCGGCHVSNTGEIGSFAIVSDRAVASGVRRIEALSGAEADAWHRRQLSHLLAAESELGVPAERLEEEIRALKARLKESEKQLAETRMRLLAGGASEPTEESEVAGVKVWAREVGAAPLNELRNLADVLRQRMGSGVVLLAARNEGKVSLIAAVTQDLKERVDAGQLARAMGDTVGGSGGGRADFAQAGGKDPGALEPVFAAARRAIESLLEQQGVLG